MLLRFEQDVPEQPEAASSKFCLRKLESRRITLLTNIDPQRGHLDDPKNPASRGVGILDSGRRNIHAGTDVPGWRYAS